MTQEQEPARAHLARWMDEAGLTQLDVRALVGWRSTGTVSCHLSGERRMSATVVRAYGRALNRSEEDITAAVLALSLEAA